MAAKKDASLPDLCDCCALVGVASMAYGLYLVSVPAMYLLVGVIVFSLGLMAAAGGSDDGVPKQ